MIKTGYYSLEQIVRLQKYAKSFASSLRFIDIHQTFKEIYFCKYSINVEDQNFISQLESKIEEREKENKKKRKKKWIFF